MKATTLLSLMSLSAVLTAFTAPGANTKISQLPTNNVVAPTDRVVVNKDIGGGLFSTMTVSIHDLNLLPLSPSLIPTNAVYDTNEPTVSYIAYGPFALDAGQTYVFEAEDENQFLIDSTFNALAGPPPYNAKFTYAGETLFIADIGSGKIMGDPVLSAIRKFESRPVAATGYFDGVHTGTFEGDGSALTNLPSNVSLKPASNLTDVASARLSSDHVGLLHMSPSGGNAAITDMQAATAQFDGQWGMSRYGAGNDFFWVAKNAGLGTNAWGKEPIIFMNGFAQIGNFAWEPEAPTAFQDNNTDFYYLYGKTASTFTNAYRDTNNPSTIKQPYLRVINGSPWSGFGGFGAIAAFTNSIHGGLVGTNAEGTRIYIPQYGLQFGQISDAYIVGEKNQAPCELIALSSDANLVKYIAVNFKRTGDSDFGQSPLFCLDTRNIGNSSLPMLAGFPKQVAEVWAVTNANWRWAFAADENSGNAFVGNNFAVNGGIITNGATVWLSTNDTPSTALPNGSIATVTDGRFFVRSNSTWVLH